MDNLYFFPTTNNEMIEEAGCYCDDYVFSYYLEGSYVLLNAKGKTTLRLEDPQEIWRVDQDGLCIERKIVLEYPDILKGKDGVACREAEVGICIIWNNKALKQMGYIMPNYVHKEGNGNVIEFKYEFPPGNIQGDLSLDTVVYIKTPADHVAPDETHLMNEAGVSVGTLDSVYISFDNPYMEFPVVDIKDPNQPLWWLELKQWEDPRTDPFNDEYVCLYLNSHYDACPKVGDKIKNIDLLIEIITTCYLMIINKIAEMGCLKDTQNDVNLEPGSIAKVIQFFYQGQDPPLHFESIDLLQKTIRMNVEKMIKGNEE